MMGHAFSAGSLASTSTLLPSISCSHGRSAAACRGGAGAGSRREAPGRFAVHQTEAAVRAVDDLPVRLTGHPVRWAFRTILKGYQSEAATRGEERIGLVSPRRFWHDAAAKRVRLPTPHAPGAQDPRMARTPSIQPSLFEKVLRGAITGLLVGIVLHASMILGGSNFHTV